MHPPFYVGEAIRFGWRKTREHSGLIFKVILTLFALQIAHSIVNATLMPTIQGFLAIAVLTVVGVVLGTGATLITLRIAKGETTGYADIVPPIEVVGRYFFASILAGIVILLGFILLIIPGIYFLLRYSMVRFAALEHEGVIEALRISGRLTDGVKWQLFLFMLALIALNILGALAFMVGLLITVPITMLAYAHVYHKLSQRVEAKS